MYLRASEITNLVSGCNATPTHPAFDLILQLAAARNLPVLLHQNAGAESTKPYKDATQYLPELTKALHAHPSVAVLWIHAGVFVRGAWAGYDAALHGMLTAHPNLHCSITVDVLERLSESGLREAALIELVEAFPDRFVVGSSTMGTFVAGASGSSYAAEWDQLKAFLAKLSLATRAKVGEVNAGRLFFQIGGSGGGGDGGGVVGGSAVEGKQNWLEVGVPELHDLEAAAAKDDEPPNERHQHIPGMKDGVLTADRDPDVMRAEVVDTHLHMLDFLQKSSGMPTILKAMDGCGVAKAVRTLRTTAQAAGMQTRRQTRGQILGEETLCPT